MTVLIPVVESGQRERLAARPPMKFGRTGESSISRSSNFRKEFLIENGNRDVRDHVMIV